MENGSTQMRTFEHYTATHRRDTYPSLSELLPAHSAAGKSIFITGAGTGIGQAVALSFAKAAASTLFLGGRTLSTLEDTRGQVLKIKPDCAVECYVMDVANEEEVERAFLEAGKMAGAGIDVLINNAGYVAYMATTAGTAFEKMWRHFEVNVKGSMLCTLAFMKAAKPQGATLVNVSSGAAVINFADGLSGYSASKVATVKMMDYMHREEKGRGLRIFNLHPGVVQTAMAAEGKQSQSDTAELPGGFVVWLASPDADFLNGRFMYANWDIDELKAMKDEIVEKNLLTLTVKGMDSTEWLA